MAEVVSSGGGGGGGGGTHVHCRLRSAEGCTEVLGGGVGRIDNYVGVNSTL